MESKNMIIGAVALVAVGAGAFWMGKQQGSKAVPVPPPPAAAPQVVAEDVRKPTPLPPDAQLPANHPIHPEFLDRVSGAQRMAPALPTEPAVNPDAKFTHFRVGNRNVKDMLADGKYVWVGTSGGVIRYDTEADDYRLFDVQGGSLLANGVFHVGHLGNDRIAVGTYGGGLSVYDPKEDKWKNYNIPNGLADAFVYGVIQLKNGDIWIATWSGANRVRGGDLDDRSKWDTFTVENTQRGLPNDWVYGLAEGTNGEVWVATEGGIARFVDEKWQSWTHEDGVGEVYEKVKDQNQFMNDPARTSSHHARQKEEQGLSRVTTAYNPNYVISLQVDARDGTVWGGTWGGGLTHFDGSKFKNYTVADGLPANHIFMLHQDDKGQIWAGTSKGLARLEGERFVVLTRADGLFSDNVFSMTFSQDGSMWVGSFGGVARIFAK